MNNYEAENSIQGMINFIDSEARDRIEEIRKKTAEECSIGKNKLYVTNLQKKKTLSKRQEKNYD